MAVFHKLQPGQWMVSDQPANYHCQLEGGKWESVDSAFWWRCRENFQNGQTTNECPVTSLLQCGNTRVWTAMATEATAPVSFSKIILCNME